MPFSIAETISLDSFDQCVARLRDPTIVACTKRILQRIHVLALCRRSHKNKLLPRKFKVSVFLAAFLVVHFHAHICENTGGELLGSASAMLDLFLAILGRIAAEGSFCAVPRAVSDAFAESMAAYFDAFEAWRGPREERLRQRVCEAVSLLLRTKARLSPDNPLHLQINDQVRRLRATYLGNNDDE